MESHEVAASEEEVEEVDGGGRMGSHEMDRKAENKCGGDVTEGEERSKKRYEMKLRENI